MNKYKLLVLGIIFDAIGFVTSSWVIPFLGDFLDVIWAPIAGYAMTRMYKGSEGKIAGIVTIIEEAIPGLDIIPSFTLMWLYTFVFNPKKTEDETGK